MDYLINELLPIKHLEGYFHTNTDTYLLASFANIKHKSRVMDLGSNNAALLLLASIYHPKCLHGIEINSESVKLANENLAMNHADGIVWHQDIVGYRSQYKYDVILCNPPYYQMIDNANAFINARHQHQLTLADLMETIHHLLENKGRAYLIYPSDQLAKLIAVGNQHNLKISRLQMYQPNFNKPSNVTLVELMLGENSQTLIEPVMVYDDLMRWKEMVNRDIINAKRKEVI